MAGPMIKLGGAPPPASRSAVPFAPTEEQIAQMSEETGASPDQIRTQLAAQGIAPEPKPSTMTPWMVGASDLAVPAPDYSGLPSSVRTRLEVSDANEAASPMQRARVVSPASAAAPADEPRAKARGGAPAAAPAAAPAPARAGGTGGGGGWRKLFAQEMSKRTAERDAAAQQVGAASDRFNQANEGLMQTQQAGLEAEARATDALAQGYNATAERVNQLEQLDAQKRQVEDAAINAKKAELDQGWQRLSEATIDDRLSPDGQALAILGVALAGIGDAFLAMGGQKGQFQQTAMKSVDAQIQRKVDKQIEALGRKRENLTARERALKDFIAQVGDDRAARDLLVRKEWENLGHLADQVQLKSQSELKRNAAVELAAAAKQQAAAYELQGTQAALTTAQKRVQEAGDLSFELGLKAAMGAGKPAKPGPSGYGLRPIDPARPPNERDTEKAQEIYQKSGGLFQVLDEFGALAEKGTTLSPTERQYAATLLEALGPTWSNTLGSGAPSESQLKSTRDAFLNPTEANLADAKRFYQKARALASGLANRQMRPYGYAISDLDVRPE